MPGGCGCEPAGVHTLSRRRVGKDPVLPKGRKVTERSWAGQPHAHAASAPSTFFLRPPDVSKYSQRQRSPQQRCLPMLLYVRRPDLGLWLAWPSSLAQHSHMPALSSGGPPGKREWIHWRGGPHPHRALLSLLLPACLHTLPHRPKFMALHSPSTFPAAFPFFPSPSLVTTPGHQSVISARSTALHTAWPFTAARDLKDLLV